MKVGCRRRGELGEVGREERARAAMGGWGMQRLPGKKERENGVEKKEGDFGRHESPL